MQHTCGAKFIAQQLTKGAIFFLLLFQSFFQACTPAVRLAVRISSTERTFGNP
jgi:hypothetical protein